MPEDKTSNYEKKKIFGKVNISKNWEIQVTQTSWFQHKPKYEIRKWKKDGTPGKGVTFNKEQILKLIDILNEKIKKPNKEIARNDVVENVTVNERGKVRKVMEDQLIVNPPGNKTKVKWQKQNCKFIRKGTSTY